MPSATQSKNSKRLPMQTAHLPLLSWAVRASLTRRTTRSTNLQRKSSARRIIRRRMPSAFTAEGRRVLLHPLPLYNNSVGAHDMGLMHSGKSAGQILDGAGDSIRAMYIAGSFLPEHMSAREDALSKLDFLVVQELFETDTTKHADVVFPAASFAETDGTFTNNDGLVQRVRQSIPPVHQSKQDR